MNQHHPLLGEGIISYKNDIGGSGSDALSEGKTWMAGRHSARALSLSHKKGQHQLALIAKC